MAAAIRPSLGSGGKSVMSGDVFMTWFKSMLTGFGSFGGASWNVQHLSGADIS